MVVYVYNFTVKPRDVRLRRLHKGPLRIQLASYAKRKMLSQIRFNFEVDRSFLPRIESSSRISAR